MSKLFIEDIVKTHILVNLFGGLFVIGFVIIFFFGLFIYQGHLNRTSTSKIDEYNMYADDYMKYASDKVEELYDKECFKHKTSYDISSYSGNQIRLMFVFNNTMSENEYKSKIKENTEKIYNALKDRYIVKKGALDSGTDIFIFFEYYVPNEAYKTNKSMSNLNCIWSYSINYYPSLHGKEWPKITNENYILNLE